MARIELYDTKEDTNVWAKWNRRTREYEFVYPSGANFDCVLGLHSVKDRETANRIVHMINHAFKLGKIAERKRVIGILGLEVL